MRSLAMIMCVALAGCTGQRRVGNDVDLNVAAVAAQQVVDNYAASNVPHAGLEQHAGGADDSADELVRRYYALINGQHFGAARLLWSDRGSACGRTDREFGAKLAGLTDAEARVGRPRDPEAGAGQRYVTVPVALHVESRRRSSDGDLLVTLHRVADGIETSDPADHEWRIVATTVVNRHGPRGPAVADDWLMPCRTVAG